MLLKILNNLTSVTVLGSSNQDVPLDSRFQPRTCHVGESNDCSVVVLVLLLILEEPALGVKRGSSRRENVDFGRLQQRELFDRFQIRYPLLKCGDDSHRNFALLKFFEEQLEMLDSTLLDIGADDVHTSQARILKLILQNAAKFVRHESHCKRR